MKVTAQTSRPKDSATIAAEWDALVQQRHAQIVSGKDLSFTHILCPTALSLLKDCDCSRVIDIGCGTGDLTRAIAGVSSVVLGIDPSETSIRLASAFCRDLEHVTFVLGELERLSHDLQPRTFTTALAGMTLMVVADLDGFAAGVAEVLKVGGRFVATLAHPWFWPEYWGYSDADWFDYNKEVFIEAPFRISKETTNIVTTHIHRPLERYVNVFADLGLRLDRVVEPRPRPDVEALYPEPWNFPRFIGLRWTKVA